MSNYMEPVPLYRTKREFITMPSSVTIRDVAKRAGVGVGTVSRVLNNSQQVTTETRQRVMAAIRALNYRPNATARQLSLGTQLRNIGVILPFVTYYSFVERLRGVQMELNTIAPEFDLVLYNVNTPERFHDRLDSILQTGAVQGLIIMELNPPDHYRHLLEEAGIAYVGITGHMDNDWPTISPDNARGGYLATRHLIDLGHRRIAYVGDIFADQFGFPTSRERHNGYLRALAEAGLTVSDEYVRLGEHGRETAQALTHELLTLPEPPTAIFAMSDIQAGGCMTAVREAGLSTPDDVSIIGFDDIELSQFTGLTTIRQHLEASGRLGVRYLIDILAGENVPALELPPLEVIERATTAPPG